MGRVGTLRSVGLPLVFAALATLSAVGQADVINVPTDYTTIQAAIDAAGVGDEIVVQEGLYQETIDFKGKAIVVRGTDPGDYGTVSGTVIDGNGSGPVVTFNSGETAASQLVGVMVCNGIAAQGAGIFCNGASPTIADCILYENGDGTGEGGGIYCHSSSAVIERNTIEYNLAVKGAGLYCEGCSPTIRDNEIGGNETQNGWGAGLYCASASPTVSGNWFTFNRCYDGHGGGIYCGAGSAPAITGNELSDSLADNGNGGAIYCAPGSAPTITDAYIWYSNATYGAAIYCEGAMPVISGSEFYSNCAAEAGGHLYVKSSAPTIRNALLSCGLAGRGSDIYLDQPNTGTLLANLTIVAGECTDALGTTGAVHCKAGTATLTNSIISDTIAGVGVYAEGEHTFAVTYCDVYSQDGNYAGLADQTGLNGNLSADPLYDAYCHLQSVTGRWDTDTSSWVTDPVHSPCIDAGDPASDCSVEPAPNGGRVNLGWYGNTATASKSAPPPTLQWVGSAGYESDGVDPDTGDPGDDPASTTFTFKARYTDATGRAPLTKRLIVMRRVGKVWEDYLNLPLTQEAGDIASGAIYACGVTLGSEALMYRFKLTAASGVVVGGAPSKWSQGPEVTGAPKLAWTGAVGYVDDAVKPDGGAVGTTLRFRVLYGDSEGDVPGTHRLVVRRNGTDLIYKDMGAWPSGDYRKGKVYSTFLTFNRACTLEYRFEFADDDGDATGEPTAWQAGLTIGDAGGSVVSTVAAVPTNAGAQVTFSLSGAANVTAEVLNVAGRPVKALCLDRPCDPGTNTLAWDARSDRGLRVPSGLYLVRVTARAEDGGQSTALATVRVR